jgi:hypothetical protein
MTVLTIDRAAPAETPQDWHPKIHRLMDYWRSLHPAEGLLPGRQHVDPGAIANLLPHLFLVDVERVPLRFKYRLVGTDYVQMMGRDLTGEYLDTVHPGFPGPILEQYIDTVEHRRPAYRKGPVMYANAKKDYLTVERLIVPLARNGAEVDMIMGVILHLR